MKALKIILLGIGLTIPFTISTLADTNDTEPFQVAFNFNSDIRSAAESNGTTLPHDLNEDDFENAVDDLVIDDPFEDANRFVFAVNKSVDTVILRPVAQGYRFVVPVWGRDRVDSFLSNLKEPVNFFNAVLQGNPDKASNAVGRFLINSFWGIGGLFDVAYEADIHPVTEDFGRTLGFWGIGTGNYIVLPIIGPSSTRDAPGRAVDYFIDPFTYVFTTDGLLIKNGANLVNTRESLLEFTDNLEKTSLDEYASIRSIYLQKRKVKR